uniref:Uncharacterized protein n=1 Tax=Meloidogyne javanica TaxID=6303 RepID=A0A915LWE0_MELJA
NVDETESTTENVSVAPAGVKTRKIYKLGRDPKELKAEVDPLSTEVRWKRVNLSDVSNDTLNTDGFINVACYTELKAAPEKLYNKAFRFDVQKIFEKTNKHCTQIIVIILKRLIIALFALCGIIRRIFTCQWIRRNQQRIGELPTFITNKKENLTEFTGGWSSWNENPSAVLTTDTSSQIEEYRKQMQANLLAARSAKKKFNPSQNSGNNGNNLQKVVIEPDLFDEIQPQVKAPKRRPGELGQLVESHIDNEDVSNWLSDEDNINFEQLNSVEQEQKRREREMRKQQRQTEHSKQLENKRRLLEQKQIGSSKAL